MYVSKKVSLEEIFLELTASDKPVSAGEVQNTSEDTDAGKADETNVKQTSAETSEQQNNDKGGKSGMSMVQEKMYMVMI